MSGWLQMQVAVDAEQEELEEAFSEGLRTTLDADIAKESSRSPDLRDCSTWHQRASGNMQAGLRSLKQSIQAQTAAPPVARAWQHTIDQVRVAMTGASALPSSYELE